MILEYPNYITKEFAKYIREECQKYIVPDAKPVYNRDGDTVDISNTPELKEVDSQLHDLMQKISSEILQFRYKPQFKAADDGYDFHRYNPGQGCYFHSDGEVDANLLRFASVILQLTTNEDGGELVFPAQNKTIKAEAGKLVIFPPYGMYGHYVTPSSTPRDVIVSWFIYDGVYIQR